MITAIDFHVDEHLIQIDRGQIRIFKNFDVRKMPIEFNISDIERILKISEEQIEEVEK